MRERTDIGLAKGWREAGDPRRADRREHGGGAQRQDPVARTRTRRPWPLLLLLALAGCAAAPPVGGGGAARVWTWSGERRIAEFVEVPAGVTLRLEPGTVLRFAFVDRDGDGIGDAGL
ncbi:MAG TPA: hypothetical protein VI078_14120, partial [bacterium]